MNMDQNNGSIHIYLKFYILGTIGTPGSFRGQNWRQKQNAAMIKRAAMNAKNAAMQRMQQCTKRETWQLRMNIDQNNGSIHIYLKFYILGTIDPLRHLGVKNGAKIRT